MLLIKNGYLLDPKSGREGIYDIFVKGDRIVSIDAPSSITDRNLSDEDMEHLEVIYADGMMVAPGLVDVHVHFRDPGFT